MTPTEELIQITVVKADKHAWLAVNGMPVQPRPEDDTPLTAAMRAVAKIVREEQGESGSLPAVLTDGDQQTQYLVWANGDYDEVDSGDLPTQPQAPATTQSRPPAAPITPTPPATPTAPAVNRSAASVRQQTEPVSTGWKPQDSPRPASNRSPRSARPGRSGAPHTRRVRRGSSSVASATKPSNRRAWLLIGGAAVAVLTAGGITSVTLSGDDAQKDQAGQAVAAAPVDMTVTGAPLGYSSQASWTTGRLSDKVPPVITLQGEILAVEGEKSLIARSLQGTQTWHAQLPAEPRQLAVRTIEGVRVAVVVTASQLLTYNMDTGAQIAQVDLTEGAQVVLAGQAPLVAIPGQSATVSVLREAKLAQVKIPAGMKPLDAAGDGTVLMGSGAGWMRVAPGATPGKATSWAPPTSATVKGSQPQIAAATAEGKIVTVWPIEGMDGKPQVAVYEDTANGVKLAFHTPLLGVKAGQQLTWTRSADAQWGVIGQQMIDLESGRVEPLGPAKDLQLGTGRGCATIGTQRAVFGPKVPLGVMEDGEKCPAAVLDSTAYVVDSGSLKALPAKESK